MVQDFSESFTHPSKFMRSDKGRIPSLPAGIKDLPVTIGSSHVLGSSSLPAPTASKAEVRYPEPQSSQVCLTWRFIGDK